MCKTFMIFILAFVSLSYRSAFAQNKPVWYSYGQSINFNYKAGFLIAHRESMAHLPMSHFHGFELSYNFHSTGQRGWEQANNNPQFGLLGVAFFNANQAVLGNAFGLAGRVTLPRKKWGKQSKWSWNNDLALGLAYLEKKFDLLTNPKNIAIGSHLNALIVLGTYLQFKNPQFAFKAGIDFTHFSNAGTIKPNLGLNIPALRFGFSWMTKQFDENTETATYLRNDLELITTGIISFKNNYDFETWVYPVAGISAHLSRAQAKKFRYTYGLDFSFSEANRKFVSSPQNQSILRTLQIGLYNGWELEINKLVFSIGMGLYAYNPNNPHGWFYHRIGGRYQFSKKWYFHGYVRSHWAKADYFESGIGYKISLR